MFAEGEGALRGTAVFRANEARLGQAPPNHPEDAVPWSCVPHVGTSGHGTVRPRGWLTGTSGVCRRLVGHAECANVHGLFRELGREGGRQGCWWLSRRWRGRCRRAKRPAFDSALQARMSSLDAPSPSLPVGRETGPARGHASQAQAHGSGGAWWRGGVVARWRGGTVAWRRRWGAGRRRGRKGARSV